MSELGINFVTVKQETNNSEDFVVYLRKLVEKLKKDHDDYIDDIIVIFDGSPTHFAVKVRNALTELGLKGLMQQSHCPGKVSFVLTILLSFVELNAAEQFHRSHKSLIR